MGNSYRSHGLWMIWLSFLIALMLQMIPWPAQIYMFRPSWLTLTLIYWVMALPHRINVGTAFVLGIIWDLTIGSTLGTHSIVLSIVIYFIAFKCQLLRNMALWQQSLVILFISVLMNLLTFMLVFILYHVTFQAETLYNSITNAVLWPWLFLLMRKIRRKFGIQ